MVQEMAPCGEDLLERALKTHGKEAVGFLILAKSILSVETYKELIKAAREIVNRSSCTEGGITAKKCEEILSEVFVGETHILKCFHHFLQGRGPSYDHNSQALQGAISFLVNVKMSPNMSNEDYEDLLATLTQCMAPKTMEIEDIYGKVKRAMHQCPELIKTFETYLPDSLRVTLLNDEQSCRSPKTSPTDKAVLCFTPDANHSLDGNRMKTTNIKYNVSQVSYPHDQNLKETEYNFRQRHTQGIPDSFETPTKGNEETLQAEEYKGDKTDPLPDWSPLRENELPPKVNLDTCTRCTTSYYLLPKNCLTLKSSYRTELGQSIFNDTTVSATSGREDCFKFRTKNHYEENIFKCEDDMFESDMLLQRYKATADFIGNLQDHVDSDMKIQEHLTPLHRRCIEQLYDEHGLDMLDALWEKIDTSTALVILHSRLNQKIDDLSEARLSLNKTCSNIIANNYHRSLDHRSSSFKQLDKRRMGPKALLAEAREINMARLNNGDRHLSSAYNNQSSLISKNVLKDTDLHIHKDIDLHIHKDIDRMVRCASKSCPSELKPMMIWTKLVQPFVSINYQLPESNGTVASKEACEYCGLGKTFRRSIPDSSFANNIPLPSKRGGYLVNTSNKSASMHDAYQTEIEEGEFIPDVGNIQLGSITGPGNGAASCDVAAPSEDGSSFRCLGNKSAVHHESREGCNVEMGSLAYSKRTAEPHCVKSGVPCCSLAVLLRLHQILYERLLVAKVLSRKARAEAPSRDSLTCDVYAGFKEELFNLLTGSTNSSNFEKYCLTFLGPKSYVLFTLNEVIGRVIKQLCKICPCAEDNSLLQSHEKVRGPDPPKDLSHHQNARSSPARPTNVSLEQDHHEEGEKGSNKPLDDTVKPMQNHFQRRKRRKLETGVPSISQPGADGSNS
ncbi:hypothetical protein SETIT_3G124800v2 [Setaria italica]|uniref:Histone deacetylase interacting domain-containing protein n=1 Tax=Setaria italica TaxID=4555 RepID=A0A368QEG8_SETIT|nr:paired amphipathic helix protein Sin3-like 5 [Setaria italica]RCV16273.1 hypothetical protein SETIT_3G124800v2 [Setaria italica]